MATKLNKPVSRESYASIHEAGKARPIVITISPPSLIGFRAKGTRRTYWLTANSCYMAAVKAHVEDERKRKAKEKREKKKTRRRK